MANVDSTAFQAWLNNRQARRCVLIELDNSDGNTVFTDYLASTKGYASRPDDVPPNQPYISAILGSGAFNLRRSLNADYVVGDIEIDNGNGQFDHWRNRGFDGRGLRVYLGSPDWPKADFALIHAGVCAGVVRKDQNIFVIKLRDRAYLTDVPFETSRFPSGPNQGRIYPTPIGQVRNMEALLLNPATHVYVVSGRAIQSVDAVYENGVLLAPSQYTVSLTTSPVTITFLAAAKGTITVDCKGVLLDGVWVNTVAAADQYALRVRAGLTTADLDTVAYANHSAAMPYTIGILVADETTVAAFRTTLAAQSNGFAICRRDGRFALLRDEAPASTPLLTLLAGDQITRRASVVRREEPVRSWTIGYKKRWLVQKNLPDNAMPPATRAEVAQEFDVTTVTGTASAKYLLAKDQSMQPSYFVSQVDAANECGRMLSLRSNPRETLAIDCAVRPFALDLGDTVQLTDASFARIVAINEEPAAMRVSLEVQQ
ncbi:MAG: hypothetical protein JNM52_08070 [Betaproteobacteria bacterium]|nr:hypothetical protein [Betaproteobacteria bacterium]